MESRYIKEIVHIYIYMNVSTLEYIYIERESLIKIDESEIYRIC